MVERTLIGTIIVSRISESSLIVLIRNARRNLLYFPFRLTILQTATSKCVQISSGFSTIVIVGRYNVYLQEKLTYRGKRLMGTQLRKLLRRASFQLGKYEEPSLPEELRISVPGTRRRIFAFLQIKDELPAKHLLENVYVAFRLASCDCGYLP